jgi:hypothetical protein
VRIRRDRLRVVRLAPRSPFRPTDPTASDVAAATLRAGLGVTGRYLVLSGRFDARLDLATLLGALAALAAAGDPTGGRRHGWPPRIPAGGGQPDTRASIARAAARRIGVFATHRPNPSTIWRAGAWRSRGDPPVLSSGGLAAIEALACGRRSSRRRSGLPGDRRGRPPGGPRDPVVWPWHRHDLGRRGPRGIAGSRAIRRREPRTWADVARETRAIYADVGASAGGAGEAERVAHHRGSRRRPGLD